MITYIFTRNLKYRPSSFYRVNQYLIDNDDIKVNQYESDYYYRFKTNNRILALVKKIIFSFIVGYISRIIFMIRILFQNNEYQIFVQREIFPGVLGWLARKIMIKIFVKSENIIWDFDDNIFDTKEISNFEKKLLEEKSDIILSGNEYLLSKINIKKANIKILNTTDKMMENVNVTKEIEERITDFSMELRLIWVGTKANIIYLESIIKQLDNAAGQIEQNVILQVISNEKITNDTENLQIENISWERALAFEKIKKAHIGLMPLFDDDITKGKCAFKAIQYIGCALPIIISDVGMNNQVISDNGYLVKEKYEWTKALIKLASNEIEYVRLCKNSRKHWEQKFSYNRNKEIMNSILKGGK